MADLGCIAPLLLRLKLKRIFYVKFAVAYFLLIACADIDVSFHSCSWLSDSYMILCSYESCACFQNRTTLNALCMHRDASILVAALLKFA